MDVVVDDHPRVPLADLVQPAADPAHAPAAVRRHGEVPGDVEVDRARRREPGRQLDPHHRAVRGALELSPTRGEPLDRDSTDEALAREVEDRPAREMERRLVQHVGDGVRREDVLLDLHPHKRERVGRVVDVVDALRPVDRLRGGIERRADHVVGALLPIVGPGCARRAADAVRCGEGEGEGEGPERGGVGDLRLERQREGGE